MDYAKNLKIGASTIMQACYAANKCVTALRISCQGKENWGKATVKFALMCLPFFAIFSALIGLAQNHSNENALQHAMKETARLTATAPIIQAYNFAGGLAYITNEDYLTGLSKIEKNGEVVYSFLHTNIDRKSNQWIT